MDCKPESAARTLCRISLIVIQGVLHGVCLFLFGVLLIPVTFFLVLNAEVMGHRGWLVILLFPWFVAEGVIGALFSPFYVLWRQGRDICEVAAVEWRARWLAASPKKPDGEPIPEKELAPQEE